MDKDTTKEKQRSNSQNNAIHLFCEMFANNLNESGYDMKAILKPNVDIPWSKQTVKEYLWKPIQKALTTKESTTEMNTKEPSDVWEVLNRHFGEKFGLDIPLFPSQEQTQNYLQSLKDNMKN